MQTHTHLNCCHDNSPLLTSLSLPQMSMHRVKQFRAFTQIQLGRHWCSVSQLCLTLGDLMAAAYQVSLSLTISLSLPKFMSIASVMPSSHLILCHSLLLLPSLFSSIRDFPNELTVSIKIHSHPLLLGYVPVGNTYS